MLFRIWVVRAALLPAAERAMLETEFVAEFAQLRAKHEIRNWRLEIASISDI